MPPPYLSHALVVGALLFAAHGASSADLSQDTAQGGMSRVDSAHYPSGSPVPPETVAHVRKFLDAFVDADKTPEQQIAFFTDQVDYYDRGIVGKAAIRRDVERFVRHWTQRSYRVTDIDYINHDPESGRVFVSYTIDFEVANRSKAISGRANYGALITNLDNAPKVASIKEKVTTRRLQTAARD